MDQLFSLFSQLNIRTLRLHFIFRYVFAIFMVYVGYFLKLQLFSYTERGLFITFYIAALFSAWFGGFGAGIFSTLLSVLVVDYFFLPPFGQFSLFVQKDSILLIIFFIQGLLVSTLISFMHRSMLEVEESLEDLQQSESRFKQLFDSNIIGVVFWNTKGYITEANNEFLSMVGYTQEDLQQEPIDWIALTPPEYKKADDKAMKELKTKGSCTPFLKEYYRKDGSRVYVLIAAALFEDSNREGVAYIVDMTEEKYAEQQRDLFIGFVSHELKNPLSSIKAYTQLLKRHLSQTNHTREVGFIVKVEEKVNLLTRLLNDMLDITKLRANKLEFIDEEFSFNTMIKNIVEDTQRITDKHKIIYEGRVERKMYADKTRMIQVFTNLLSNAVKYSPKAKEVIVKVHQDGSYAVVTVQDFGIGISKEEQRNIFEPLFRSQRLRARAFPGTGLGLFIAYEIVRHYQGKIHLQSEEGKGSTFTVRIPFSLKKK